MKQYILLDWDGNLAKTLDIWLDACRVALENQGVHKTDEEIGSSFGQFTRYMKEWGVPDIDRAIAEADVIAKKKLPDVDLYPDALIVLETLKKSGKKLALITTSPHENIAHLLKKHGLKETFDTIVAADDTTNHKPHPEPLEVALSSLGGSKSEAVMIGDSDKDLGAAQNAEIDSVLFYPDEHRKFYDLEKLKTLNPTYIVSDFKEVLEIVDRQA